MARHGENIYKRKDGRWEGRYIKGYDANGKSIPGYVYGKTYKEAKEKLTFAKVNAKEKIKRISSDMTVSDWFDKWLDSQKRIKRSSYTTYSSNINKHIKKKLGKIKLKMLTDEHITITATAKSGVTEEIEIEVYSNAGDTAAGILGLAVIGGGGAAWYYRRKKKKEAEAE